MHVLYGVPLEIGLQSVEFEVSHTMSVPPRGLPPGDRVTPVQFKVVQRCISDALMTDCGSVRACIDI